MSCDGFGVVCHVMDLGCVRRMSCDGLEVGDADWI